MRFDPTNAERQRRWYRNHAEQKKAIVRQRYHALKDAGICVICGQREAKAGRTRCGECKKVVRDEN